MEIVNGIVLGKMDMLGWLDEIEIALANAYSVRFVDGGG